MVLALASLVFTAPAPGGIGGVAQCNTGKAYCCDSIQSSNSEPESILSGLLGASLGDVPVQVGLGCTPISVVGVLSGPSCAAQPACCENVQLNGLANLACTPLSL